MALSLTTITGTVDFPGGATPARAFVRFQLASVDVSSPNVFVGASDFTVAANGTFSAQVQSTDGMDDRTLYEVTLHYFDQATGRDGVIHLGNIKVPEGDPVVLADLLPVRFPGGASSTHRVKRGDTISLGLQMLDRYNRRMRLSGITVSASMRLGGGAEIPFAVVIVDAALGLVEMTISAGISSSLALGAYDFDIKLSDGAHVGRTLTGTIIVDERVTS